MQNIPSRLLTIVQIVIVITLGMAAFVAFTPKQDVAYNVIGEELIMVDGKPTYDPKGHIHNTFDYVVTKRDDGAYAYDVIIYPRDADNLTGIRYVVTYADGKPTVGSDVRVIHKENW